MKSLDVLNKRFGRLLVISKAENSKWLCQCDCGNQVCVKANSLSSGRTMSCGCYHKEQVRKAHTQHGLTKDRIYHEWQYIKRRCYNESYKYYPYYGGKGVIVCDEWKNSFGSFYSWAMANGYSDELTLDRIDYNGNYEPSNCRWITRKEQQNNTSANLNFTIDGETKTLAQWCEQYGVPHERTRYRVKHGWDILSALTTPPKH